MDINGRVIMSLDTYDKMQRELIELQTEVERLKKELDGIRVFELMGKSYDDTVDLMYTDFAQKQYKELVLQNPHLEFKTLDERAEWDIAKRKVVEVNA